MIDTPFAAVAATPLLALFGPVTALGAAAVAVSLPLLVHLLFRKRYQIVQWAAIRFLVVAERRHRRRIDQWLLMLLRTMALLIPLFAMVATIPQAEELWQRIQPGKLESVSNLPRTHHVLVIDGSLSMTAKADDGRSRFEHAIEQAEGMVRNGNPGDGYSVVFVGSVPQPVVPGPSNDADKVAAEIRKLKSSHTAADITPALALIADTLKRSPRAYPRRQVTFLSDLQRSTWTSSLPRSDAPPPEAWKQIAERADVVIVDLARTDVENLAVVDLALADPLPLVDAPTSITASVHNYGRSERRLIRLELLLGRPSPGGTDALVPVEQKTIDAIPAGGRSAVTFSLDGASRFRERGVHLVQVRLVEGDDLPADDTRAIAIEVRDGLHVMIVDGKKSEPEPLRRGGEYLSRALAPPGSSPSDSPARLYRPGERPPETLDQRWILQASSFADATLGDPTGADCVFLCDLPRYGDEQLAGIVARLEAHLKRGGGVVIGLGPNAVANREQYNRILFNKGNGLLPGPIGELVTAGPDEPGFRLFGEDDAFRRPPLAAFRDDNARAGLVTVPFRSYLRMDAPPDGRARRILSFVPAVAPGVTGTKPPDHKPDPAVVEWPRHRGRVIVYTSTFNRDWTDWPVLPSYLPFVHELLRFASSNPDRHTIRCGDAIEEYFPASAVGLSAGLTGPDGITASLPVTLLDDGGVARYADTGISGLYRLGLNGARDRAFAVNVPEASPAGGAESDLRRIDPTDLKALGPVQVVNDPADARPGGDSTNYVVTTPKPWGPQLARYAIMIALLVLVAESVLAWWQGPSRMPGGGTAQPLQSRWYLRLLGTLAALVPLGLVVFVLFTVTHAEVTGNLLGFLPEGSRHVVESSFGVPSAAPGESTRWRLEGFTVFVGKRLTDRWIVGGLAFLAVALAALVYLGERGAVRGPRRLLAYIGAAFVGVVPALFVLLPRRLILPALFRATTFLLMFFVLLPQLQLAFDREGWPEVVILVDTSASMSTVDELKDPAVLAKAEELRKSVNLSEAHRLKLAQLLLTRKDGNWLDRLLTEKQVKVYIYAVDTQTRLIADLYEPSDADAGRDAIIKLAPEGDGSRLGDGVQAAIKAFRGGSLSAIIMFTDGITTSGDDLPKAAREASRAGVPLYFVGMGDNRETPDLALSDLQSEEVVTKGDKLAFAARVSVRGKIPGDPLPVVLYEKQGDKLVERGRTTITPDLSGNPVPVKIAFTPMEVGEKVFVLDVPVQPGEADTANNRIERTVLVTDARRTRVLYVEGTTRYEFRFVKVLLERESERIVGNKSIELKTVLLDASRGWPETDKSALAEFPTRDQLFEYDVVILGDVDPKQLPRANRTLQDLADFVKIRGGGLLFITGEHAGVAAFTDTPLAEILPVIPIDGPGPRRTSEEQPITEGYRPKLTPTGRLHPLFRFSTDDLESERIWNRLQPLLWFSRGYRRKLTAEVLAEHPTLPSEGGPSGERHPLVLQQFSGSGRVVFLGFDETWRWRWRDDEEQFNKFWVQAVRVLARSRLGRIELKLDRQTPYRRDERIVITVRFPDDAPAPADGTPVRVSVQRGPLPNPDGTPATTDFETQNLTLAKVEGTRATYQAALTRTPIGEYRFQLVEPEGTGTRPRAEAKVLPPPTERDRLEMNKADMAAAAALTNGGFYTLADAEKVFDDMKELPRVPLNQPVPPTPLWNQPAAFGLLVLLLLSEWLLRKRERLL